MNIVIKEAKLKGFVTIPPSKSLSHRAIITACLAGSGEIHNLIFSKDMDATMGGMQSLGYLFEKGNDYLKVSTGGKKDKVIDCLESGSTVRFLIPLSMAITDEMTFLGRGKLMLRPLDCYLDIFNEQGIPYERGKDYLPLTVKGRLKSGVFKVPGNVSSQFITGLLLTLPLLKGDSILKINGNLESKAYVDLTIDVCKKHGIKFINHNYESFEIPGNQVYQPIDSYTVEGDYSQAAFWLVYGTFSGGVRLKGMDINSNQGDKAIIDIINQMGGNVYFDKDELVSEQRKTKGSIIDLSQAPDLGPIVTVLAALSEGETRIINAERLRIKECDRITAMRTELNKLGANILETQDGMIIQGVKSLHGGHVDSWNDHRIVMALAIGKAKMDGDLVIHDYLAIEKSYPHFFKQFQELGGVTDEFE